MYLIFFMTVLLSTSYIDGMAIEELLNTDFVQAEEITPLQTWNKTPKKKRGRPKKQHSEATGEDGNTLNKPMHKLNSDKQKTLNKEFRFCCDRKFTKGSYFNHIEEQHFTCRLCFKKHDKFSDLKSHLLEEHNRGILISVIICDMCGEEILKGRHFGSLNDPMVVHKMKKHINLIEKQYRAKNPKQIFPYLLTHQQHNQGHKDHQ